MRSLGSLGTPIYGIDDSKKSPALRSKYLKKFFIQTYNDQRKDEYFDYLVKIAKDTIKRKAILIPTSDELVIFVADYRDQLKEFFFFPDISSDLAQDLADKKKLFELATKYGVPTPDTQFPQTPDNVKSISSNISYPVMLKAIDGGKLYSRTGKKMEICKTKEDLIENFKLLDDPSDPNLMIQELIPGDDDQVFIFNGYFDNKSNPLISFTGHKIRQFPVHVGCASLGECSWNQRVADKTCELMKKVKYKGILDIGYRYDARDGKYKVLDINPRVGQAFRLFLADIGMDVVRSLYLDLTGQSQPESRPREGRRWLIEDYDLVSAHKYYKEGTLGFVEWIKSFSKVEEMAWLRLNDPGPAFIVGYRLIIKLAIYIGKMLKNL